MPHFQNNPINIVGTFYTGLYSQPQKLAKIIPNKGIVLKREPHNPHDSNAIKVYLSDLEDYIGYVPKGIAERLAPILDRGSRYESYILFKRGNIKQPTIIISLTTYPVKIDVPRTQKTQSTQPKNRRPPPTTPTGKPFRRHKDFSVYSKKYFGISGIYIIWNRQNKVYVGQSKNVGQRWVDHTNKLFARNHQNENLQKDWVQMGAIEFRFDLIEEVDESDLDDKEAYYVKLFGSYYDGYNCTPDGQGNPDMVRSRETPEFLFPNGLTPTMSCAILSEKKPIPQVSFPNKSISSSSQENKNTKTSVAPVIPIVAKPDGVESSNDKTLKKEVFHPKPGKVGWVVAAGFFILLLSPAFFNSKSNEDAVQDTRKTEIHEESEKVSKPFPSVSLGKSSGFDPRRPSAEHTREAQQLLIELGYDPGLVDGKYGNRTANAVKAFQRDAGLTQNGWIDQETLTALKTRSKQKDTDSSQQQTLVNNKETSNALSKLAASYYENGQIEKAIETYQKAVRINPEDFDSWYYLGVAYGDTNQWNKAIEALQKALSINPEGYVAWSVLGYAYRNSNETAKAVEAFQQALHINPKDAIAWYNLGLSFMHTGEDKKATWAYQNAVKFNPDFDYGWYQLGLSFAHTGENAKAITSYQKAVQINPEFAYAWSKLGLSFMNIGEAEKAIEAIQKAIIIESENADFWYYLGLVNGNIGQTAKAIEVLKKAVNINPKHANAWAVLGYVYDQKDETTKALEAYQHALRINPENAEYWFGIGVEYGKMGQSLKAIEAFQNAVTLNPEYADVWYNLGIAYKELNQKDKVIEVYQRLKELDAKMAEDFFNN